MCLTANREATRKFKTRKRTKNFIIAYKVMTKENHPLYYQKHTEYKPGWYVSNAKEAPKFLYSSKGIYHGFHVCLTLARAKEMTYNTCDITKIVKVKCYVKDLFGIGGRRLINNEWKHELAVFKKGFFLKKDFDNPVYQD